MMRKIFRVSMGDGLWSQLLRGGIGSAAVKAANLVLMVALTVVLARTLGAKGYGTYSFVLAIVQMLRIIAQLGFPLLVVREVAAYKVNEQWGHLKGVLDRATLIIAMISICLAAVGVLVAWYVLDGFSSGELKTLSWGLVLLPLIALGAFRGAVLRGLQHVVLGQFPEFIIRPAMLLVFLGVFLVSVTGREMLPEQAMVLHALAGFIAFLAAGVLLRRSVPAQVWSASAQYDTARWFKSAATMCLVAGIHILNNQTDIIMLGVFMDAETVGVYRVSAQGAGLVAFALQAAHMVVVPHFSRMYAVGQMGRLQRLAVMGARISLAFAVPMVVVFVFYGDLILSVVFGEEFGAGHYALIILALGQLINAAMGSLGALLNMTNRERIVATVMAISAVLNVILNLILIPLWGIEGAAVANSASLMCWNLLLAKAVREELGFMPWAFGRLKITD